MFKKLKQKSFYLYENINIIMKTVLLIDNHDSFTYILKQYLEATGFIDEVKVVYPEHFSQSMLQSSWAVVISPGPGDPHENLLQDIIDQTIGCLPLLGICLGMQALVIYEGGKLYQLDEPLHGVKASIRVLEIKPFFEQLGDVLPVGLYHSWATIAEKVPSSLHVTAVLDGSNIAQAVVHKQHTAAGLQFHPESHLTPDGLTMLKNWFKHVL